MKIRKSASSGAPFAGTSGPARELELEFPAMRDSFPQEIMHAILFRLPIKCLIRCTSVCKSWRSMIRNPNFIGAHLSHTINCTCQDGTRLLLLHCVSAVSCCSLGHSVSLTRPIKEVYSLQFDNHAFDEYSKIEFPVTLKEIVRNSCFRVVGICNGLVCLADDLHDYCDNFIIWNPSIRKSVSLTKPSVTFETHGSYDACIGFGYDDTTNEYKVVRLVHLLDHPERKTVAEVYSLTTGSWRSPGSVTPKCSIGGREPQAFVNGAVHWAVNYFDYFVLTFDVGSELFGKIMMPKCLEWNRSSVLQLCVSGDRKSIALFTIYKSAGDSWYSSGMDAFLDIWVMKEYSVEESWTKLVSLIPQGPERNLPPQSFIEMMEMIASVGQGRDKSLPSRALYFRQSNEEVLVLDGARHELLSLDVGSQETKNLGICGYQYCHVDAYEESLVLLDKTNAVSY